MSLGEQNQKKKLAYSTIMSVVSQVLLILSGFVLPKLLLDAYGSEINGLVKSISQFLNIIAFLELGVGAVVQSSLYKPLAEKDAYRINCVITSGTRFFRKLAAILLVYVVVLIFSYPLIIESEFEWIYTATLIFSISISSFAQYYFGIMNALLLKADQKGYINYIAQSVVLVLDLVGTIVLIRMNASIQLLKLTSSLIFLIRPLYLQWYINKNYNINTRETYSAEPIKQKWNGVAQHIAAVVLESTDVIVLTMFLDLATISVYGVYNMVCQGLKQMVLALTAGVQSVLGEMYAKKEREKFLSFFRSVEFVSHTLFILIFAAAAILIVPFIQVYTNGINDANYDQPLFAYVITFATAIYCLALPYHTTILAAGHYKQTQQHFVIAAAINVVSSVIAVSKWGLVGVAVGTLLAMLYQFSALAIYSYRNILLTGKRNLLKMIVLDILFSLLLWWLTHTLRLGNLTYFGWIWLAIQIVGIGAMIMLGLIGVFFRAEVKNVLNYLRK